MMRINLLPPEILERRKAEKRIAWVILAAVLVAVALAAVWGFAYFRLQGKQDELAAMQQQVESTNAQAAQLAIFEERAAELETRRATAEFALQGRRNWARLLNELSLVLPTDVWLTALSATEQTVDIQGMAIDSADDSPDAGHKSMAKVLLRLADLDQLSNVWLMNSAKSEYLEQPVLQFGVTADISESTTGSVAP
ncbi:MAG: PilN domain-containing protein [Coriobacteriia bacterium]